MKYFIHLCMGLIFFGCQNGQPETDKLFSKMESDDTGISFSNDLSFDKDFNIFTYRNFYNGGGVGLGDINNDGLLDIYLTSNQQDNKLYLNTGNLKFQDITDEAGVAGEKAWSTGVSIADVDGDGWQDIYVCNSGDISGDNKRNELFINNGDNTFSEQAEKFGLADQGFSTHAAFFDYDKDGDLDLYLLNNSYQAIGSFDLRRNERPKRDSVGGDKLYRNDDGLFSDVSEEAGIYGSIIGFGLGVTIGDVNGDFWPDIYVSNDFFERDYLYINQKDGTFEEDLENQIRSISAASMGADMADINNDNQPDIFVTDMLPEPDERVKTVTTFENWDKYQYNLENGYYHQFTRNMLQLNNGDNTFSEIGRLAGVEATDWSWGALIFDFENDGRKDIFIANGIYQDLTNQDFLHYVKQEEIVKKIISKSGVDYKSLIELIPSVPVPNYAYRNEGSLQFTNKASEYGLDEPGFSNGAAYGDLDNDGDLDLIVNNVNMPVWIYRNNSREIYPDHHYLQFDLKGTVNNRLGFGSVIEAYASGSIFRVEQMPIRGFESTVDHRPLIGLGTISAVDSLHIIWPNQSHQWIMNPEVDQMMTLDIKDAQPFSPRERVASPLFEERRVDLFQHEENHTVDFDRDRLLYHMRSSEGPCLCSGDFNQDGLKDIYIGGASGQNGELLLQQTDGTFEAKEGLFSAAEKDYEEVDCAFFDANGDGYPDLYIAAGGSEFNNLSSAIGDRLLINNGGQSFEKVNRVYPNGKYENTGVIKVGDVDQDGDQDLFVGVRMISGYYGVPASSYLLINDGSGNFSSEMEQSSVFSDLGIVTDAIWTDLDQDSWTDLVVVGEWMSPVYFKNEKGRLVRKDSLPGSEPRSGWYQHIQSADFNQDGTPDLILGNHGLNSRFQASTGKPVSMYVADFDQNGTIEQIITQYNGEESYPLVLRHDLVMQLPALKKRYLEWNSYSNQEITDIFPFEILEKAMTYEATHLATTVLISSPKGYRAVDLPIEAQFSVTYDTEVMDFNSDGNLDIILGGNQYQVKPEVGRYDAQYGLVLLGDGQGNFEALKSKDSGLYFDGQTRKIKTIKTNDQSIVVVANNSGRLQIFEKKQ